MVSSPTLPALLARYLKAHGHNMTAARTRIAETIAGWEGHFSAAQLWARLGPERIAPATIYRALDLLVEAGLVRRLCLGERRAEYEVLLGRRHHDHLCCARCGALLEFYDRRLEERLAELTEELGYLPQRHALTVYGLCRACLSASGGEGREPADK